MTALAHAIAVAETLSAPAGDYPPVLVVQRRDGRQDHAAVVDGAIYVWPVGERAQETDLAGLSDLLDAAEYYRFE